MLRFCFAWYIVFIWKQEWNLKMRQCVIIYVVQNSPDIRFEHFGCKVFLLLYFYTYSSFWSGRSNSEFWRCKLQLKRSAETTPNCSSWSKATTRSYKKFLSPNWLSITAAMFQRPVQPRQAWIPPSPKVPGYPLRWRLLSDQNLNSRPMLTRKYNNFLYIVVKGNI